MAAPILLLGSRGQVGFELRRTLAPLGPVIALGRADVDLAEPGALRAAVRVATPALIVNAAAYTAVDKAEGERDLAFRVNAQAPGVLAEEAARSGARLVHFSTDYVFDGAARRPYREDDPTGPLGAYGESKLAGEQAVRDATADHLILRTAWVYAARGRNFLLAMRRLAREREELRVVDDQRGAPTWARAIAEATALMLARGGPPGTYHLSAAGETTWHGFASAIVAHMADAGELPRPVAVTPITTADYPTPARRPAYSVLDGAKLAADYRITLPHWRDQFALCLEEG